MKDFLDKYRGLFSILIIVAIIAFEYFQNHSTDDAETEIVKTVKVPVLNMRECPKTDCKIVKKLEKNDRLIFEEEFEDWSKVKKDDFEGYVISRSIENEDSIWDNIWSYIKIGFWVTVKIVVALIIFVILTSIISAISNAREKHRQKEQEIQKQRLENMCDNCKKEDAWGDKIFKEISREYHPITKMVETVDMVPKTIKTATGEKQRFKKSKSYKEVVLSKYIVTYEVSQKCKYCGYVKCLGNIEINEK